MGNSLQAFQYQSNKVRTILVDEEVWFVASDVAKVLGYRMASDLTRRIDEDDKGTRSVRTPSGNQTMTVISHAGLIEATVFRKSESGKQFRRWVTHEVLPEAMQNRVAAPAVQQMSRVELLAAAFMESQVIIAEKDALIQELEPQVRYYNKVFVGAENDYDVRDAAQLLINDHRIDTGEYRLFKWLRENGWLDEKNRPRQDKLQLGLMRLKVFDYIIPATGELRDPQARITPKGLERIRKALTAPARLTAAPVVAVSKAKVRRSLPAA